MKLKATSTLALTALLASMPLLAQTTAPAPDYTVSFNAGVTNDYRFRGIAQTSTKPALQVGADFTHKDGFYLGAWGSNVSWIKDYVGATKGSLEIDLYGGYRGDTGMGVTYDVGLITYQYPSNTAGNVPGFVSANTTEIYGAATYSIVTAKYSRSLTNFIANANSKGSQYLEVAAAFDLGNGYSVTPRMGRQWIPNVTGDIGNYTDYGVTLGKDFGNGLSASVAATGTNASKAFYSEANGGRFLGKEALVVGLKYSF
jgi:uncharacterized protein (TIGR02001 family)